jgi:hypothetical protein
VLKGQIVIQNSERGFGRDPMIWMLIAKFALISFSDHEKSPEIDQALPLAAALEANHHQAVSDARPPKLRFASQHYGSNPT